MVKKLRIIKAQKGFTLVELLVVIAIIGVLAAILIPTISGVINDSKKSSVESTCQSIQQAAKTFTAQALAKKSERCKDTTTVDMSDGNGPVTLANYLKNYIPELNSGSANRGAEVTLKDGAVIKVVYAEGDFVATWDEKGGGMTTVSNGTGKPANGVTVTPANA